MRNHFIVARLRSTTNIYKEPLRVAFDLNNLAEFLRDTDRFTEAEPLYRRALDIREKSLGMDCPEVATVLNNLALLLKDTNRLAEAEPLMRRALEISEKSRGMDHPEVATALNNLALLLQDSDRPAEAEPLMHRSLEIFLKGRFKAGADESTCRAAIKNYASLLRKMGWDQVMIESYLKEMVDGVKK